MSNMKHTIDDCRSIAKGFDGDCLSSVYMNNKSRLKWACKCGHVFYKNLTKVLEGNWCTVCNGTRHSIDECAEKAASLGGQCLEEEYVASNVKMRWECIMGHRWSSAYAAILSGKWCKQCVDDKLRSGIGMCRVEAESRRGQCLSEQYVNARAKLIWKCNDGHIWSTSYDNIKRGTWCPRCKLGKSQRKLAEIVESILKADVKVGFTGFGWLINDESNASQHIDIYVPSIKLAIEYDGEQHYAPVCFGGSEDQAEARFKRTVELDRLKDAKVKDNPDDIVYSIRIKYDEPLTIEHVKDRMIKVGVCL
jgi:hypothetical protein